jgi:hypothetical protein
MSDTPQVLLAHHLKALKLPTFLREHDKLDTSKNPSPRRLSADSLARHGARRGGWDGSLASST